MFVLTQLPTFPQLLNASPGKAIRGCAPKVLAEPGPQLVWIWSGPQLVWIWSGPQLVWIWSGPGLVLVAAWLPRVTGVRSTVLPSHFWAALLGRLVLVLRLVTICVLECPSLRS